MSARVGLMKRAAPVTGKLWDWMNPQHRVPLFLEHESALVNFREH
jgi:hypothetical protein